MIDRDADRRRHLAMLTQTNPEVAELVEAAQFVLDVIPEEREQAEHDLDAALAAWRQAKEGAK